MSSKTEIKIDEGSSDHTDNVTMDQMITEPAP